MIYNGKTLLKPLKMKFRLEPRPLQASSSSAVRELIIHACREKTRKGNVMSYALVSTMTDKKHIGFWNKKHTDSTPKHLAK